ncbi:MAG: hypothetical protein JXB49_10285 [Bacteroidales bacterium]|nr:hypothetical protein [Bacteroidales bacterium]
MRKQFNLRVFLLISLLFSVSAYSQTRTPENSLKIIADRLVSNQSPVGAWGEFSQWNYTGPIVAGLVQAYDITKNPAYKGVAEDGADFIILFSGLNFLGDEAYALARLGKVTGNQVYIDIVRDFYNSLDTYQYIAGYDNTTPEKSTFYISFHAVASKIVNADDAGIWREAVIRYLSHVDDDLAYFPVMTLGVATWALAQTGPMDDTLIDPFGLAGIQYWKDVTLSDLPDILSTHQVLYGEQAGSFYVRYDHTAPSIDSYESGYTEDTIFSILGMMAANDYREDINDIDGIDPNSIIVLEDDTNDPGEEKYLLRKWNFDKEIQDARDVLAKSVSITGMVQTHIWNSNQLYYFLGGEVLETYDSKYIYPEED